MTNASLRRIYGLAMVSLIAAITAAALFASSQPVSAPAIIRAVGVVTAFAMMLIFVWLMARRIRRNHRKIGSAMYGAGVGLATCYVQYFAVGGDLPTPERALVQVATFTLLFVILNRKHGPDDAIFTVG